MNTRLVQLNYLKKKADQEPAASNDVTIRNFITKNYIAVKWTAEQTNTFQT